MAGSKFKDIPCPDCGRKLKPYRNGKYICDNPKCPVISVWPGHEYGGADKVLRDAVMVNAKK